MRNLWKHWMHSLKENPVQAVVSAGFVIWIAAYGLIYIAKECLSLWKS